MSDNNASVIDTTRLSADQLRDQVNGFKDNLDELKRDTNLSEQQKREKADEINGQAENLKRCINEELNSLHEETQDVNDRKQELQTILDSFSAITQLYNSIVNPQSTNQVDQPQSQTENKNVFEKAWDWIKDQWKDVQDKDKWKDEPGKNILRTAGFVATGVGAVSLLFKGIEALFGGGDDEDDENGGSNKKEKKFWDKRYGKALKWGIIGVGGYWIGKYFGWRGKDDNETGNDSGNGTGTGSGNEGVDRDPEDVENDPFENIRVKEKMIPLPGDGIDVKPEDLLDGLPTDTTSSFKDGISINKDREDEQNVTVIVEIGDESKEYNIIAKVDKNNNEIILREKETQENEDENAEQSINLETLGHFEDNGSFTFNQGVEQEDGNNKKYIEINGVRYDKLEDNGGLSGKGYSSSNNSDTKQGILYVGDFRKGIQKGKGTEFRYHNGECDKYEGIFMDGKYEGQGTYTYDNGNKFTGEFNKSAAISGTLSIVDENSDIKGEYEVERDYLGLRVKGGDNDGKYLNDSEWKFEEKHPINIENLGSFEGTEFKFKEGLVDADGNLTFDNKTYKKFTDGDTSFEGLGYNTGVTTNGVGWMYIGDYKGGKKEGNGTLYRSDNVRYDGNLKNDSREGRGRYIWDSGDTYDGLRKENKKEGRGRYTFKSGDIYEGNFVNDNYEGQGTYTYKNGNKKVGEWSEDEFIDGTVNIVDENSDIKGEYEVERDYLGLRIKGGDKNGQYLNDSEWKIEERNPLDIDSIGSFDGTEFKFKEGLVDDDGNLTIDNKTYKKFTDGDTSFDGLGYNTGVTTNGVGWMYIGDYKGGKKEGNGTLYRSDNVRYDGNLKNDSREGRGRYIWDSGDTYDGLRKENKKEGRGRYTFKSGDIYEGNFVNDNYEGQGTYTYKNGNKKVGEWSEDKFIDGIVNIVDENSDIKGEYEVETDNTGYRIISSTKEDTIGKYLDLENWKIVDSSN